MTRDPVCGKEVDPLRARAVGIWGGRTYYFCSPEHKSAFGRDPAAHGGRELAQPVETRAREHETPRHSTPPSGSTRKTPVANPVPPPGAPPRADDTLPEAGVEESGPIEVVRTSRAWLWAVAAGALVVAVLAALLTRR